MNNLPTSAVLEPPAVPSLCRCRALAVFQLPPAAYKCRRDPLRTILTLIFLFSFACVFAGETGDTRVVTTVRTNAETQSVYTIAVFTRDGQTNLVRRTKTKSGLVQIQIHRFFHAGRLVGDFIAMPGSAGFTTEAGTPYSVSLEFGPSQEPKYAVIGTKDGLVLDAFACTNGFFSPVESSLISKANGIGADLPKLLSPSHVRTTTPEEFREEVRQFIETHKDK